MMSVHKVGFVRINQGQGTRRIENGLERANAPKMNQNNAVYWKVNVTQRIVGEHEMVNDTR